MTVIERWWPLLVAGALILGGCGGDNQPEPSWLKGGPEGRGLYTSIEGGFRVAFPSGCDSVKVQTMENLATPDTTDFSQVVVFCDRANRPEEGCSVLILNDLKGPDGGPPTPELVIERVKMVMSNFRVVIQDQRPLKRGDLEGVQVHCRERNRDGEVWIEGFLAGGKVVLLTAWKASGYLFEAPEMARFFQSFELLESP